MKYNLIKATILIKNIKVKTKAEKFVQAKWETLPQKVRQGSKNSEPDGAITNSEAGTVVPLRKRKLKKKIAG